MISRASPMRGRHGCDSLVAPGQERQPKGGEAQGALRARTSCKNMAVRLLVNLTAPSFTPEARGSLFVDTLASGVQNLRHST